MEHIGKGKCGNVDFRSSFTLQQERNDLPVCACFCSYRLAGNTWGDVRVRRWILEHWLHWLHFVAFVSGCDSVV